MSLTTSLGLASGWPDRRSRRQIEREIAEELQFHLDRLAAACQEEQGASAREAERHALDRMGDMDRYKRQCRNIIMRERTLLKWVTLSLLLSLIAYAAAWGVSFARVMMEPTAPFTAVAWEGWTPHVQVRGTWYALLAIDEEPVSEIMAFCRRRYRDRARKRFSEDLGQVLFSMAKFPGSRVDLTVRSLDGTRTETLTDVSMSRENRNQTWRNLYDGTPFSYVVWTRDNIWLHLDERVYRLDAYHGVAADELLRWREGVRGRVASMRGLFQKRGRPIYLDDIEVHLTDLETQAPLVRSLSVTPSR